MSTMVNQCGVVLCLIVIMELLVYGSAFISISKSNFSDDFIFGAGSSAYQNEGAANIDGKGPSNWDYYVHKDPNLISDGNNGDVTNDFYHRYKEDIKIMKYMGLDSFRFSISWSRILPKGTKAAGVNQKGIAFYNNVIDELLRNGIQPFVTLYHFDLPYALEEEYQGILNKRIVADFVDYADVCFKEFGDRVKHWVTINEPNIHSILSYAKGVHVPNHCTPGLKGYPPCRTGNSSTEPYIAAHHLLLAHASTVKLYREKYQATQNGKIGISIACDWTEPYDQTPKNIQAASRHYEQFCGWFFNPVKYGVYPYTMRILVGNRLPTFTMDESNMLKNSFDFIGLNSYTGAFAQDLSPTIAHYDQDDHANVTCSNRYGPIGDPTPSEMIWEYPKGLEKLLIIIRMKYENPLIIVTENGYPTAYGQNETHVIKECLEDSPRIDYIQRNLNHILQAIKSGVNVKGYFVWSFMDDLEWNGGYLQNFGLIYVDRKNSLRRLMKESGKWFKAFLSSYN